MFDSDVDREGSDRPCDDDDRFRFRWDEDLLSPNDRLFELVLVFRRKCSNRSGRPR